MNKKNNPSTSCQSTHLIKANGLFLGNCLRLTSTKIFLVNANAGYLDTSVKQVHKYDASDRTYWFNFVSYVCTLLCVGPKIDISTGLRYVLVVIVDGQCVKLHVKGDQLLVKLLCGAVEADIVVHQCATGAGLCRHTDGLS